MERRVVQALEQLPSVDPGRARQNDAHARGQTQVSHTLSQFHSVHVRHVEIDDRQVKPSPVVGTRGRRATSRPRQSRAPSAAVAPRRCRDWSRCHPRSALACPTNWRGRGFVGFLPSCYRGRVQGNDELEHGALVGFTLDPDASAHDLRELLADHEAQAGAAVSPGRGGVHLAEGSEQAVQTIRRDAAAGVANREVQRRSVSACRKTARRSASLRLTP